VGIVEKLVVAGPTVITVGPVMRSWGKVFFSQKNRAHELVLSTHFWTDRNKANNGLVPIFETNG
jgi:hypothetical protein